MTIRIATAAVVILLGAAPALAQAPHERTKSDWIALRDGKFAVPEGQRAVDLLVEMNALVASTDPVLRDEVAFEGASRWIRTRGLLTDEDLRRILAMWTANLRQGLGTAGTDAVFARSFSALNLSVLALRDNALPFLTQDEFDRFLDDILEYFARERDTRGYDPDKGWIHAAAHTADTLKFLARNAKLRPAAQARILAALDAKCATFGRVFEWAEDERLGQVVASLARRADLDRAALTAWLAGITARRDALWARAPSIEPAKFPELQNLKMVLRAAYVALSLDAEPAAGKDAAAALLATLRALR